MLLLYVALSLLLFYSVVKWKYFTKKGTLPGPPPTVLIGNLVESGLLAGGTFNEMLAKFHKQFGDFFQMWLGPDRFVVVSTPEAAQQVFSHRFTYDQSQLTIGHFRPLAQNGLITLLGSDHKRHLRWVGPMLKLHKVSPFLPHMVQTTELLVNKWKQSMKNTGSPSEDLKNDLKAVTMDIFGKLAFNYDFACLSNSSSHITTATATLIQMLTASILSPVPQGLINLYLNYSPAFQGAQKVLRTYVQSLIDEYLEKQQKGETIQTNLLSMLMESLNQENGSALSKQEVIDEIVLFIFAGFETTSTTIGWFIYFMCKNPRVQQKVQAELKEKIGENQITNDNITSLTYLDDVMKEVFRFAPTAGAVSRSCVAEDEIAGHKIHVGDTVMVSFYAMHLDSRYWKHDPTQFYPERFTELDANHSPYVYSPFGGGHRACAGQQLARFEAKAIAATLLKHCTFHDTEQNTGGYVQGITILVKNLHPRIEFN